MAIFQMMMIFLTNNGDMVNRILRAGNNHEKEYVVTVNKPLTDAAIQGMANGVPMLGVTTKKCKIVQEGPKVFRIILVQGLNRQIRRMCEHYNYEVTKLERVRIMKISLKGIPVGEWRELTESEMKEIYRLTEDSSSEVQKSAPRTTKSKPATRKPTDTAVNKSTAPRKKPAARANARPSKAPTGNRFAKPAANERFAKPGAGKRTGKPKSARSNDRNTGGKKRR